MDLSDSRSKQLDIENIFREKTMGKQWEIYEHTLNHWGMTLLISPMIYPRTSHEKTGWFLAVHGYMWCMEIPAGFFCRSESKAPATQRSAPGNWTLAMTNPTLFKWEHHKTFIIKPIQTGDSERVGLLEAIHKGLPHKHAYHRISRKPWGDVVEFGDTWRVILSLAAA